MSEARYRIVFAGEVAAGHDAASVKQAMGETFKLPAGQVEQLFSGRRAVLKKDMDADAAERLRQVLSNIGAVALVEPMQAAAPAAPAAPPPPPPMALEPTEPPQEAAAVPPPAQPPPAGRVAPDLGGPAPGPAPAPELPVADPGGLYAPPSAPLEMGESPDDMEVHAPQRVEIGRGWGWIADGGRLFGQSIGMWIATVVIAFVLFMVLSLIPLVNVFVPSLLFPVFGAGFMIAAHRLARGGEMSVGDLFAGFSSNVGALIGLGAIYMVGYIVILGIAMAMMFGSLGGMSAIMAQDPESMEQMALSPSFWLMILMSMGLTVPLMALMWFSPALIALHGVPLGRAMKWSFIGCFKNFLPFLLYGIVAFVITVIATIPFGLGLLISTPIFIASIYAGYRDIYLS